MEKKEETLVLDLPNISSKDLIKLTEQITIQSGNLMDVIILENKDIIIKVIVKDR